MVYTQDSMYKDALMSVREKEEEKEREKHGVARPSAHSLYDHLDSDAALDELMRHLKAYYSVSGYYLQMIPFPIYLQCYHVSFQYFISVFQRLNQSTCHNNKLFKTIKSLTLSQCVYPSSRISSSIQNTYLCHTVVTERK